MISKTPEDYQYYEDRLKFLRDEEAKLADAKQEGREAGRAEGKIQVLQELLEEPITPDHELRGMCVEELTRRLAEIQQRLRDRPV